MRDKCESAARFFFGQDGPTAMTDKLQFLVFNGPRGPVRLSVNARAGKAPTLVWLGGFMSDMTSTKAAALDAMAEAEGLGCVRFDYSGHGVSEGRFEEGTIGQWLEESLAVIEAFAGPHPILIGSSMGGWIALLATLRLKAAASPRHPSGLVLIAPAVDFTEALMWAAFPPAIRQEIETTGRWLRPSEYSENPYPITRGLIEDGRRHLLYGAPFHLGCPVHILQGGEDPDVPADHALKLVEHLPQDRVTVTVIPDGNHRLSRDEDIARLVSITRTMALGEAPARCGCGAH